MLIKRKNIISGLQVAFVALGIYLLFLLLGTDYLICIKNEIESIFSISSNFDVEIFREGIKTIASGIFVSALVAVLFYVQEYKRMKTETIKQIIFLGRELCEKFDIIPSFPVEKEEATLKKEYYLEYKKNKSYRDAIDEIKELCVKIREEEDKEADALIEEFQDKIKLIEEMISHKAETELICFWRKSNRKEERIYEELSWLIDEYDKLIIKSKNCYLDILSVDLHSLRDAVNNFDSAITMSKKQRDYISEKLSDNDKIILGNLTEDNYSLKDIAERTVTILERAQKKVAYTFEKNCVNLETATEVQLIDSIMELKTVFIREIEIELVREDKKENASLTADYKVMRYYLENLFSILIYETTGKYNYLKPELFVRPATRYSRGTFLTTIITDMDTTLDMRNIYR